MSIKWALGAAIAVMSLLFVMPGIASAHHPEVNGNTECNGEFVIDADYSGGDLTQREYVWIDGKNWDDSYGNNGGTPPTGMTVTQDSAHYVEDPTIADYYKYAGVASQEDFFVLKGDYQSVQDNGGDVAVAVFQTNDVDYAPPFSANAPVNASDSETVTFGADGDQNPDNDWEKCVINYCQAGDSDGGADYSFLASPDNNCDPVRLCVDGESMTVTEFAAESLDGEKGSCTPTENPPPTTTTVTVEQPQAEPEEEAVAEVSPAVEEVVALPSAGFGRSGSNYSSMALAAFLLIGIGTSGLLLARRHES
jgi:hypothetical protein